MIWNHRLIRITIGLVLLVLAVIVFLPGVTGVTSLDGTVNARFVAINAPIDGAIAEAPARVGVPVVEGQPLLRIVNARVNRATLASLRAEHNAALDRAAALKRERDEMIALRQQLSARLEVYKNTTVANLEREVEILRKRVEVSQAQDLVAQVDLDRRLTLEQKGILTKKLVESARAAGAATGGEVEISNLTVEQLQQKLDAVRQGIFIGDGQNDVPYSRQREDEVLVRINDLNTRIAENETRAIEVEKQIAEESNRVDSLTSATVSASFDGVVWSSNIVNGSNVLLNNELMRVLDCRELFVDILVPEGDYDEISVGRTAEVRLFGRGDAFKAVVLSVRGSSAIVEKDAFAANQPVTTARSARIRLSLAPSALNTDFANFCQVGRTVQVRLSKHDVGFKRWIESLWFSIS